jgi:hypothetical protein
VTVAGASCDYGNGGSAARTGNSSTSSSASATVGQSTPKVASAGRNFRPEWVSSYAWLSFDEAQGACFCSTCKQANYLRLLQNARFVKEAFIDKEFSNWKHALERFGGHEKSECHRTAVMKMAAITSGTHVLSNLNKAKQDDMLKARSALLRILTSLTYLAKQGLAIRGKTDKSSNFHRLLLLLAADASDLNSWLARTQYKWLSHEIQNELLLLLADDVLHSLLRQIEEAKFFSIMADETMDCSRKEQLAVCFRYCDNSLETHELFMGFYELAQQDATTLFNTVTDVLSRFNINISNCRGQCYDGAANVAGSVSGLQTKMREVEPKALFVHCNGHNLNLVVQDAVSTISQYRDAINMLGHYLILLEIRLSVCDSLNTYNSQVPNHLNLIVLRDGYCVRAHSNQLKKTTNSCGNFFNKPVKMIKVMQKLKLLVLPHS